MNIDFVRYLVGFNHGADLFQCMGVDFFNRSVSYAVDRIEDQPDGSVTKEVDIKTACLDDVVLYPFTGIVDRDGSFEYEGSIWLVDSEIPPIRAVCIYDILYSMYRLVDLATMNNINKVTALRCGRIVSHNHVKVKM